MLLAAEMDARNGAQFLSKHGWLSRTPDDFRTSILRNCVWQNYEAGESLCVAGDPPGGIFGIADGSIGTSTLLGAPDAPMVHLDRPGFWSGVGSILSGEPRRMSASAITPALIANVQLPALQALLSENPRWWQHIGQLALITIDIIGNGFVDLMIRDSGRRCAAILLRLCECRFKDAAEVSREVMVTQEEMANMANLSRATVNTILRRFAKQRLIELRYRSIIVVETKSLRKLANGE
jgi:CRP/FNR family transcriptional regulator, cyclic AMP receptor protein